MASFIDSNILVYAESIDEPEKQAVALALLRRLKRDGLGVLSTQVLHEYCNVGLRKLRLNPAYLRSQVQSHEQYEVVQVTTAIIHGALDLHQTRSVSFYDALILQAAVTSGCDTLFTEDMNNGELINGVRVTNPFANPNRTSSK